MIPAGRRSKIRPPRKSLISSSAAAENSTTDAVIDFDKNWSVLANAISQIQNKNVSNLSYEQLYRKAYVLVLRKFGEKLYNNVAIKIQNHLLFKRKKLLSNLNSESFMSSLLQEWDEHLQSMKFISDVLMYLNRVYVKENKKLLIYDLGIQLFKDYIIKCNHDEVGFKVVDVVLDEITRSRSGQVITSNMYITKIISMMELLIEGNEMQLYGENYYQTVFEPKFLSSSGTFFQNLSQEYISYNSGSKFLHLTTQFIKDEENRIKFYLPSSTYPKLIDLMNNILIKDKLDKMMLESNQGLEYWLKPITNNIFDGNDTYHFTDLKLAYNLNGRFDDEYQLFRVRLREAIVNAGNAFPGIVRNSIEASKKGNSTAFATKWIEIVLKFREQMNLVWKDSFDQNPLLEQTITFAMRDFINGTKRNPVNAPELLSIYMDFHIKQQGKSKEMTSGDPTQELIENSIQFLRFIKDKDAFEANYANHFAKRFLNSKNSQNKDIDIEEMILGKLSEEMGTSSLDKVIKMNKDINSSRDLTNEWKKYLLKNTKLNLVELDLKICNVNDWPKSMTKDYKSFTKSEEPTSFKWPRQLRSTMSEFEEFWSNGKKNDNKSLYWSPKFGSMDLRITYPSRTYEFNLSTYAGIIMLLFAPQSTNPDGSLVSAFKEQKQLTYLEIVELTGIPEQELKRHLQSIAVAPKSRLLIKIPMSKDVNETDVFKLNEKFKAPSVKVKVLTVSSATTKVKKVSEQEEKEEVDSNITEGRKIEVNAAIVRILKSRQTIKHNQLIEELIKQLSNRFQPSIILIKQRIEDLIEKEYLKRDDEDRTLYHYIA
ncbi:unnamed protein product [Candida verbasci]|uniref:Cullin family profile domain-containing protein n=1 Tax=Candida verbasci TaxID=1227364 RepID=A0A9W4TSK5_9ASCO|nr:unnamed protein product [Candida verbasci]